MTPSRLPPLNGLKVFEIAARHLSFSRAAQELCVTNAAVSHQIKQLEEFLGLRLFDRRNNQLGLTCAGERYAPRVREALRALQSATDRLLSDRTAPLRVGVPPVFGEKWLVPRLYRFFNRHPEISIDVASATTPDLRACDLLVADRRMDAPGLVTEHLVATDFFPVCAPALHAGLRAPRDLAHFTLLHDRNPSRSGLHPSWPQWLAEVGEQTVNASRGLGFSETSMGLQAAIDGQGIALGQSLLVDYDIAAGRLVRALDVDTPMRLAYYLIFFADAQERPELKAFRRWLQDEIENRSAR
ncbi:transcriptional regulator GcvA [Verminephrobacter aporrectodeae subsp. tuberculatae]|uniref:transcriptional regulator GcvA n=1 Tax=Verminephrobacter aporrectodeae TaxID=1110389 RepID=UPI00224339E5|nr:transcriptional regulator GcvA [Verminephrobacter aporrectodeae]MCW8206949.1 transcriptional regulator GcvA [Verminephrobacter aporrectodeae subsp. tuberculatae]